MLLPAVCHAQPGEPATEEMKKKDRPARPFAEAWKAADRDQDGFITAEEFAAIPRIQKLPGEKRANLFKRLDKDADAKLSHEELNGLRKSRDGNPDRPMKRLWQLDADTQEEAILRPGDAIARFMTPLYVSNRK